MEGVGADQVHVLLGYACFGQLLQNRLDGQAAHRPEGGHRGVVEGDEDMATGTHKLTDARKAKRSGESLTHGGLLVGHRLQAGSA